jgi:hypothetical protein
LEDATLKVLKAIGKFDNAREYESSTESVTLGWVVVRQVESIAILAKRDLVTIPAALVISRSVLEMTARILWMLRPETHMQRKARWLALLGGEANHLQRLGKFQHAAKIARKFFSPPKRHPISRSPWKRCFQKRSRG